MHAIEIIVISLGSPSHKSIVMTRINPSLIIEFFIDLTQIRFLVDELLD